MCTNLHKCTEYKSEHWIEPDLKFVFGGIFFTKEILKNLNLSIHKSVKIKFTVFKHKI